MAMLVPSATAPVAQAENVATVMQMISTTSTQRQTGRLNRDTLPSDCAASPKLFPGVADSTTRGYIKHTFQSSLTNPVCVTIALSTSCTIFSVAYIGQFDPANIQQNYVADMGYSTPVETEYSFEVGGGAFFSVVVHEMTANAGCAAYTLTATSDGPWATSRPSIGGTASVGGVLTGTDAVWKGTPAVQRRWLRCDPAGADCAEISGETGASYTVTDADLAHTIRFRNDATDADGTNSSLSDFVEPFIPFETHAAESLAPGDRTHSGIFVRDSVESRCTEPKSVPTILLPASTFFFDSFPVISLVNEPVCLVVRTVPACTGGITLEIYNPVFVPASGLATNYAANSGTGFTQPAIASLTLPPGGSREAVVSRGNVGGSCASYGVTMGADAPFAGARPSLSGTAVTGDTLTASDGAWSGTPVISRSWLRCDADGAACDAIAGAIGASYTPTAADVGKRLRARVIATQGRSVSSDSEPSAIVVAGPDRTGPNASLRLASRNLKKAVRSGRIPVSVTSDELCSAVIQLTITKRLAKQLKLKKRRIARVTGALPAGRAAILRPKLTRAARRALRGRRSLKLRIGAVLTDAAGNSSTLAKRGALKRPRR